MINTAIVTNDSTAIEIIKDAQAAYREARIENAIANFSASEDEVERKHWHDLKYAIDKGHDTNGELIAEERFDYKVFTAVTPDMPPIYGTLLSKLEEMEESEDIRNEIGVVSMDTNGTVLFSFGDSNLVSTPTMEPILFTDRLF